MSMIGEDGAEHALETEANSLSEVAHVGADSQFLRPVVESRSS